MLVETGTHPTACVGRVWLADFRCFTEVDVEFAPGLTVVHGANAQGKTSLLEAIGWVARALSFRGVPDAALVRTGATQAVVRSEVATGTRIQLFEAEIRASGRNRVLCNKQTVARARDLHGLLRVSVFAPDDLALVKEGPATRRDYLDELLAMIAARYDAARTDFERVVKQRNALLRGGVRDDETRATLAVFDDQLVRAAVELVRGRLRLLDRLGPAIDVAYGVLAQDDRRVSVAYDAEWAQGALQTDDAGDLEALLRDALARRHRAELDRGLTLVGPHRDELRLKLGALEARSQASQGEQRTLALALRLAGHGLVTDLTGVAPVLLLDDVFSELDAHRTAALVQHLPPGQTLITTAGAIPLGIVPDQQLHLADGRVFKDSARE